MADITITAANVLNSSGGLKKWGTFGETITAGQSLYRLPSDGRLYKADANASILTARIVGVAADGGSAGQPGSYWVRGTIAIGGTTVVGTVYVLSATAGGIAPIADLLTGMYTSIIGVGKANNTLQLVNAWTDALVP